MDFILSDFKIKRIIVGTSKGGKETSSQNDYLQSLKTLPSFKVEIIVPED